VVEIDAASNNGVDNVRDIVEAVKYRPARDRFKVFVIDEVHMLSQGAFNALLKTLEEPPEHVKFVLATTDVHKVPETIVSRCQRFDFRRLTQQQIADQLGHVAGEEGMKLSGAALAMVARAAEGGMRDALSLLDRVRAACGEAPSDGEVADAVGTVDVAAVGRMAGALLQRDGASLLAEIAVLHERGLEMKRVAEELARHLRNVVVARLAPAAPLDLPDTELAEVQAQASGADPAQLTRLFDLAQRAVVETKLADQPRHALEVALLKAVFLAPGAEVSALIARVEALAGGALPPAGQAGGAPRGGGGPSTSRAAPNPVPAPPPPSAPPRGASSSVPFPIPVTAAPELPAAAPEPAGPLIDPAAPLAERWRAVVDEVEKVSPAAAPVLKQATLRWIRDGEIGLQLPAGLMASTAERRRTEIEAVFARCFGRPTRLALTLGEPAATPPGESAPVSLAAAEQAERLARTRRVRETARAHPNIQQAAKLLEGGVDHVEEL
jgi:DNA polymerase-3 subunit gamma/tau